MTRVLAVTLLLCSAGLSGCEALSNGTFMQWDERKAGRLALVSLHIEGLAGEANTPRAEVLKRAMLTSAEDILHEKFTVVPASEFVGEAAYRANAKDVTNAGVVPTLKGHALASFTANPQWVQRGRIPGEVVAQLATDLQVKWIAVAHTKWASKRVQSDAVLKRQKDGSYGMNTDDEGLKGWVQQSVAETTLTIYSRSGMVLLNEQRIGTGGRLPHRASASFVMADDQHRRSIVTAFELGLRPIMRELHAKPGGIEHRPEHSR